MKFFAGILTLLMLVSLLPLCGASAQQAVNCYWQLESVSTTTALAPRYGSADADADAQQVSGLTPAEMMEAVRGESHMHLFLDRASNASTSEAEYAFSGMPALVPGSARARLSIAATTRSQPQSFYLYMTVAAQQQTVSRIRGTGAWVIRVPFPRKAVPGEKLTVTLKATEYHGYAVARTEYVYRACPGTMLIDVNGDIVLYDANDTEINRIPQTVADILPELTGSSAQDSDTIFSAEAQQVSARDPAQRSQRETTRHRSCCEPKRALRPGSAQMYPLRCPGGIQPPRRWADRVRSPTGRASRRRPE